MTSLCFISVQDLVEKVMILRQAVESSRGQTTDSGDMLCERLSQYAGLLAAQGSLATASSYLSNTTSDVSGCVDWITVWCGRGFSGYGLIWDWPKPSRLAEKERIARIAILRVKQVTVKIRADITGVGFVFCLFFFMVVSLLK